MALPKMTEWKLRLEHGGGKNIQEEHKRYVGCGKMANISTTAVSEKW